MVRVIAAVRCQVERDRDALAAGGQRLAVEGVRFLGGRETRVLADGPGTHGIHRGLRAADKGLETGQGVGEGQLLHILGGVERLDRDTVRREPVQLVERAVLDGLLSGFFPISQGGGFEFGRHKKGHLSEQDCLILRHS